MYNRENPKLSMFDPYTFVPEHMRDSFILWIEKGIPLGSFGMAVLSNDLKGAVGCADTVNKYHLNTIVAWLYNNAPQGCWGSEENVKTWKGLDNGV